MGRPDLARGGRRGGEDVQALRQARTRLAAGAAAFACAAGLAALALGRADEDAFVSSGLRVAIVALLALVAALVRGWAPLLPAALVLLGGLYGAQLALDDAQVDIAVPLVATGLVLVAELGYWSLEEREQVKGEPGDSLRRLAFVALLALGTLIVTASLLALVDAVRASSLTLDLLGAAAAATALVAIVLAARDRARTDT